MKTTQKMRFFTSVSKVVLMYWLSVQLYVYYKVFSLDFCASSDLQSIPSMLLCPVPSKKCLSMLVVHQFYLSRPHYSWRCVIDLNSTVWLSGTALVSINEVTLRWARLVLGWMTSPGKPISVYNQPASST